MVRNKSLCYRDIINPINAKIVQLIELHDFAYCLLFVYLSESFDFLKINTLYISATCVNVLQISCKSENKHP